MSEDEKNAIVGRTVQQLVFEKREVALLSSKIKGFGQALGSLGRLLQEDFPTRASLANNATFREVKDSTLVNTPQILDMLAEFHARVTALVEIRKKLAELGIPDLVN